MKTNDVMKAITGRRSIRKYTKGIVPEESLQAILEAGRWAPSGLNNQPWSFAILRDPEQKNVVSKLTTYSRIIVESNLCICVFYNIPEGYDRDKDTMSIGACIQNMLLAAHSFDIGAVWLGEILNRKADVNSLLGIGKDHELMAVIALGLPAETPRSSRKKLQSLILKEI